jgi:uncharacterized Zn finger protein (UPF0148 family)
MEGYCVKCKTKREIQNPTDRVLKSGAKAKQGKCPVCSTGMFRITGKA